MFKHIQGKLLPQLFMYCSLKTNELLQLNMLN